MCGRFAQIEPVGNIIKAFFIDDVISEVPSSYNITPGSRILSIIQKEGKRMLVDFQWGLIPQWAKDPAIGQKLINARAETVCQKPSFRSAFKSRRCLVVASGFYEWKKEGRIRTPFYVKLSSGGPFGFAGLYETWVSPGGIEHHTCSIITTEANSIMKPIHDRMPVIVPRNHESSWLDTTIDPEDVRSLLKPFPADEMDTYQVSPLVNSPEHNSPECIKPAV